MRGPDDGEHGPGPHVANTEHVTIGKLAGVKTAYLVCEL